MAGSPPSDRPTAGDPPIDPFANVVVDTGRGGEPYSRFVALFRTLQDSVVGANPPDEVWDEITALAGAAVDLLAPWAAPEREQPAGTRTDLPGRGNPLLVPFALGEAADDRIAGRAEFRPFHLGGNGAAHGGTLPLLFDEVMGRVANSGNRPVSRTAFLTVNYRSITPIGVMLNVDASVDRVEGRKRWVSARLTNGATLVADAVGLFVELRPGQP
jgi:acyl-coenzyme A thioesterase PaaI-like protein